MSENLLTVPESKSKLCSKIYFLLTHNYEEDQRYKENKACSFVHELSIASKERLHADLDLDLEFLTHVYPII